MRPRKMLFATVLTVATLSAAAQMPASTTVATPAAVTAPPPAATFIKETAQQRKARLKRSAELTRNIAAVLAAPDVAHGMWGVEVRSLATGELIYSLNAGELFTPASNTKLFTTVTAFALL